MPDERLTEPSLFMSLEESAQQQLAESVTGDYKRWKQSRTRLENKWRECWETYLCDSKSMYTEMDSNTADRSRVVRPVLYEAVEAIHANLLNALFPANERFFSVIGKTEADHQNAQLIEEFLRTKLEDNGFLEKYSMFLKQAVITGNTVASTPWKRTQRSRRVNKPVSLFGLTVGYQKVVVDELVYNGPDFEVLDIFDFLVDPNATHFESAKVIRRVERSLRELQENPAYSNLEHVYASLSLDSDGANKASRRRAFGIDDPDLSVAPASGSGLVNKKVNLLEAWGDFAIEDQIYRNYVCVVANEKTVIRFEPNPYDCGLKPFVFTSFIPVPNEVYGIGAIEKSLGLQHAINTLTNQKLDVINITFTPVYYF